MSETVVKPLPVHAAPVPAPEGRFPAQIRYILGNEVCERFSFYGMRSILVLYAVGMLGMKKDSATEVVHLFGFAVYFTPLIGAWLSDRFWGRYNTILRVSLLYCVGHATLALSDLSANTDYKTACLYVGLTLIAFGAGGIKPCVSAFMGDQFNPGQSNLIARAYSAFYWCINLGSLASFLLIPWVREHHGYGWAFGIPGILMAIATFVLWLGRKNYTHVAPGRTNFVEIFFFALMKRGRCAGDTFWAAARRRFPLQDVEDVIATLRAVWVFLLIPPFFALFDQTSSTWILQGEQMTPLQIGKYTFGAEQMQSANPAFVMLLIPLLALGLYPLLGKLATPLRRMSAGMFIAAISFLLVGLLQVRIEDKEVLSILWQLGPYLVLTISEILVSTTGLEFAFTQAPKRMKSIVTSFWLVAIAMGNLLVVAVTRIGSESSGDTSASSGRFFLYAGLMAVTAVAFSVATSYHKYRKEDAYESGQ